MSDNHDPRVDAYIARAEPFARPILEYLRAIIHEACPDAVETIKWSRPFFESHGAPLCNISAFKHHCSFGFWLGGQVVEKREDGMGQFGKLVSPADLPPKKALIALIRKAVALNEGGARIARPRSAPKPPPRTPDDLAAQLALKQHAAARRTWEASSPSMRREYVQWITEAKTEPTRQKRLATTLEWLAEGKPRNWKYRQ